MSAVPEVYFAELEKIIPIVERAVVICMEERIAEERYARMRERRARVSQAYTAYRGSTLPATWAYHPSSCQVAQYAPFAELVHSPDTDPEVFERRLADAVSLLPQFVRDIPVEGFGSLNVHYVHKRSSLETAVPLLFIHGCACTEQSQRAVRMLTSMLCRAGKFSRGAEDSATVDGGVARPPKLSCGHLQPAWLRVL